ncbi:MAG: galactosyldiacylglycerol synthase [Oscillospiraceae bacterium]|nr:galactosyldiacylglycerol synthase [Oscillospiraceae bacterium]
MKILILSASTGGGHMKASNAVKEYFEENNIEVNVVDTLKYISPLLNKTVTEGYEYLIKKMPNIYKMIYESANNKIINRLIFGINSIVSRKLIPLINEYEPDVIVTTHPFPNEMVSKLKHIGKVDVPAVCIMTDYAPHRTWLTKNIDAYIVANEDMMKSMAEMGVDKNIIYPFGIPIEGGFYTKRDQNILLKQMGFNLNIPTVLVMAGSFGVENIVSIYKDLLKIELDFQIIVITGKNAKLYDTIESIVYGEEKKVYKYAKFPFDIKLLKYVNKLNDFRKIFNLPENENIDLKSKIYYKDTRIIYFTDEVHKYMYVADLIITKPGGLTITEALACNLPMAIFDAIPGQEEENADFLVDNNMAVRLNKNTAADTIKDLLKNKKKLKFMKHSCETFDKSESLKNILNFLLSLPK